MKRQITILIFIFFNCLFAWSRGYFVKTTNPCETKYIPQLIVYRIDNWEECHVDQPLNPYKPFDENFPIKKLEAMIIK